jgi:hypothetical protein
VDLVQALEQSYPLAFLRMSQEEQDELRRGERTLTSQEIDVLVADELINPSEQKSWVEASQKQEALINGRS